MSQNSTQKCSTRTPRSHDCMPDETEFAETFQDAQEDLERREKNANKRRTMLMWKNALDEKWRTRPIEGY